MNQDGRYDGSLSGSSYGGKLLLTLCNSFKIGEQPAFYPHAIIPFPQTYDQAKSAALRAFSTYFNNPSAINITLKCAIRRKDGSTVWASINPSEWSTVVCSDDEEIGVFTSSNSHAPYLASSDPGVVSSKTATVRNAASNNPNLTVCYCYIHPRLES